MCRRVFLFCVFLWCASLSAAQQCSSLKSETLKFCITSRRNDTGHWLSEVTMDHGADEEEPGLWNADVAQVTSVCDGKKSVSLQVNVTAPPQPDKEESGAVVHKIEKRQVGQRKPDSSYEFVRGMGYFKFHPVRQNWHFARETCAIEGTQLLVLNSEGKWNVVKAIWDTYKKISPPANTDFLHYGITDHVLESNFVTLSGDPVYTTGYTKWGAGEPNNGATANCGALRTSGELFDSYCTNLFPFVCHLEV